MAIAALQVDEAQRHLNDQPLLKFGSSKIENGVAALCQPEKEEEGRKGHTNVSSHRISSASAVLYNPKAGEVLPGKDLIMRNHLGLKAGERGNSTGPQMALVPSDSTTHNNPEALGQEGDLWISAPHLSLENTLTPTVCLRGTFFCLHPLDNYTSEPGSFAN